MIKEWVEEMVGCRLCAVWCGGSRAMGRGRLCAAVPRGCLWQGCQLCAAWCGGAAGDSRLCVAGILRGNRGSATNSAKEIIRQFEKRDKRGARPPVGSLWRIIRRIGRIEDSRDSWSGRKICWEPGEWDFGLLQNVLGAGGMEFRAAVERVEN